jgi:hypothetical protein
MSQFLRSYLSLIKKDMNEENILLTDLLVEFSTMQQEKERLQVVP